MLTVGTAARVVTADAGEEGFGRFDCHRLWLGHLQGRSRGREVRALVVGGEQPVVADALKTGGLHVAQEAADELGGWQRDRALAPGAIVPCPDSHLIMVTAEDALIRNRHPMRVARQVVEHLGWPARRRLRIHHPVVRQQRVAAHLPRKGLSL